MLDDSPFNTTDSSIVYENPWIKIHEDAIIRRDGAKGIYGFVEVGNSVTIVAVDNEGKICLVEAYRYPFKQWFWELPGGGDDGEDAGLAGARELEEEAKLTAGTVLVLGRARVCNGLTTEYQTNVLATDLTVQPFVDPEDETRARKFVSLDELERMIAAGDFADNQSITALYMYKSWLQSTQ